MQSALNAWLCVKPVVWCQRKGHVLPYGLHIVQVAGLDSREHGCTLQGRFSDLRICFS